MDTFESAVWKERRAPDGVLTDEFVRRFDRYVNWPLLSRHYGLDMPMDMIRTYQHRVIWPTLLQHRLFSEYILREMAPNFDVAAWEVLSKHQKLSEEFIHDFASKVDWELVISYQNISGKFQTEHNHYMFPDDLPMIVKKEPEEEEEEEEDDDSDAFSSG